MKTHTTEWIEQTMRDRGYSIHTVSLGTGHTSWTKLVGELSSEDSFFIFASVSTDHRQTTVKLSSNVLKMMISMSTPAVQFDHPNFDRFESKLIEYVKSCMDNDFMLEALAERKKNRELESSRRQRI